MAKFAAAFSKGVAAVQSIAIVAAAAASPRRAKCNFYQIGSPATPADVPWDHIVQRCTTVGTATAVTPNAKDPADTLASTIQVRGTCTADPTLTANAFLNRCSLNQRVTYVWQCGPGDELLVPATANNGFIIGLSAANAIDFSGSLHYDEQ